MLTTVHADQILPRVQAALRAWFSLENEPESRLDQLLSSQRHLQETQTHQSPATLRRATNEVLLAALESLSQTDPRSSQLLRSRFLDLHMGREVASQLNLSLDQVNRLQALAIRRLTEIIVERELALWAQRATQLEESLPPAQYHCLFGVDGVLGQITAALTDPELPAIVVIAGLGGLGKTALADATARWFVAHPRFSHMIWLNVSGAPTSGPDVTRYSFDIFLEDLWRQLFPDDSAQAPAPPLFDRVRSALKERPTLVVIDNLESDAEVGELIEHLPALAGPSRFLLTSRVRPSSSAGIFALTLHELDVDSARQLVLDHAAQIGMGDSAMLTDSDATAIVELIGGNPLALRLAVGMAAIQPLSRVLAEFSHCGSETVEPLFRRIYWRLWHSLSQAGRTLLLAAPLIAENGASPEQLAYLTQIEDSAFWPAIQELASRSLLEVRGSMRDRRYSVHHLTRVFVGSQLIHQFA